MAEVVQGNLYYPRSLRLSIINWGQLAARYVPYVSMTLLLFVAARVAHMIHTDQLQMSDLQNTWVAVSAHVALHGWTYALVGSAILMLFWRHRRAVYCVDFACFDPPESWRVTHDDIMSIMDRLDCFSPESMTFMKRILETSATGQSTHWPPGILQVLREGKKYDTSIARAREEAEVVMFGCFQDLLNKTGLKPKQIDFLIINCSLFSPTPSLCAMIVNKFHLRQDVRTYNLSGQGCSAGVISIDLAKQLLQNRPNSRAVVISTENLSQQLYLGNERSMLLQNTLFRCGGAAILLSNMVKDSFRAKYQLLDTVRTQYATDEAFHCVYEQQDEGLVRGIHLAKNITTIAGRALTNNLTLLGPRVLTIREQLKVVKSLVLRRICKIVEAQAKQRGWNITVPQIEVYVPNFKSGIQHFCIHAGGRAVIDGIEQNLKLDPRDTEPSKKTLREFGNTSSSSIWYELRFVEESGIRRGDRVLQIAFGSGFKCNSAVWLRLKN